MKRLALILATLSGTLVAAERPNILWFVVDDMSANFSCYGETTIQTPHVDRLARDGTKFTNAFVTAPVCSACRLALITGTYQTSIGAHHHRSGRGVEKIHLPGAVELIPALLQKAGYFTCIGSGLPQVTRAGKKGKGDGGLGKTDYNFEWDAGVYDGSDWGGRKPGQPFFRQVQLAGGKLRGGNDASAQQLSQRARQEFGAAVQPQDVTLPPYYSRDPVLLRDWAAFLDAVMAEWTSARDFATRRTNLNGHGTGERPNADYFLSSSAGTVIEDNAADVLTGSSAEEYDWFFLDGCCPRERGEGVSRWINLPC